MCLLAFWCMATQVWMLTGDKEETAINIGYATRMLNDDQTHVKASSQTCVNKDMLARVLAERAGEVANGKDFGGTFPVLRHLACNTPMQHVHSCSPPLRCSPAVTSWTGAHY